MIVQEKINHAHALFGQLQKARNLDLISGIDALIQVDNPVVVGNFTQLVTCDKFFVFDPRTLKLYVRVSPVVASDKLAEVKKYIEKTFGFQCTICYWSFPVRLDIALDVQIDKR